MKTSPFIGKAKLLNDIAGTQGLFKKDSLVKVYNKFEPSGNYLIGNNKGDRKVYAHASELILQ